MFIPLKYSDLPLVSMSGFDCGRLAYVIKTPVKSMKILLLVPVGKDFPFKPLIFLQLTL